MAAVSELQKPKSVCDKLTISSQWVAKASFLAKLSQYLPKTIEFNSLAQEVRNGPSLD